MVTYRSQRWKIVLLFIAAFVGMILPIAVGLVLLFSGPPPYLVHEDQIGPEWNQPTPRSFPDGSSATVYTYPSEAAAREAADALLKSIPRSSTELTPSVTRYTQRESERRGLILTLGGRVIQIEAGDDAEVDARLASLPFVEENPEKGPLTILFTRHLPLALLGIIAYLLLWFAGLVRGGAWAASIVPAPGVMPASAEALQTRLLAVNDLDLPFQVREESGRLVAEWRIADARWIGLMEAGGLTTAHQIHLELDPKANKVRAQDRGRVITWSAGVPGLGRSSSFFRGIDFWHYDRGALVGLFFKDGGWTTTAYTYRFQLPEMKNPLIQAIVESGWTYAPVVTFFRLLGG